MSNRINPERGGVSGPLQKSIMESAVGKLSSVSIIIHSPNALERLQVSLPFVLRALEAYPPGGEILVIGHSLPDAVRSDRVAGFPKVRWVNIPDHESFDASLRAGVKRASHDVMILLEADVQPDEGFISPLVRRLEDPRTFCVQSAVCDQHRKVDPFCLGRFAFRFGGLKRLRTSDLGRDGWFALCVTGGAAAYSRSRGESLGLWAPGATSWGALDLGIRAWRQGFETWLEPRSIVLRSDHPAGGVNTPPNEGKVIRQAHKLLTEWSHFPGPTLLLFGFPRLFGRLISRLIIGDFGYFLAIKHAFSHIGQVVRARSEMSRLSSFSGVLMHIRKENEGHTELERKRPGGCCNV